jgi:Flp pilus assembly pilin Flp
LTTHSGFSEAKKVGLLGNKDRRKIVIEKIKAFMREEDGLTIVEYAVAAGLITALVAGAFTALGVSVENVITTVTGYLPAP